MVEEDPAAPVEHGPQGDNKQTLRTGVSLVKVTVTTERGSEVDFGRKRGFFHTRCRPNSRPGREKTGVARRCPGGLEARGWASHGGARGTASRGHLLKREEGINVHVAF